MFLFRKKKGYAIPRELQYLFSILQEANVYSTSTRDLTDSFQWSSGDAAYQHDAHELNRVVKNFETHPVAVISSY